MKPFYIFLGGAAVGAIAALLLAPETGVETRERLKEYLKRKGLLPTEDSFQPTPIEDDEDIETLMERITAEINEQ